MSSRPLYARMQEKGDGGVRYTHSHQDSACVVRPQAICLTLACTQAYGDMQTQKVALDSTCTQLLAVPHAETQPLGVRPLPWMVVMIFGHLARDRVVMATTKQQSNQQPSA